jgi:hypothetical protein
MRGLHTRNFFWQWHAVYAASNPGHAKDHWQVEDVSWTKQRHVYWGEHYSMQQEVRIPTVSTAGRAILLD